MYKHLSPSPFSLNFAITAGGNSSYSCVQLIIRVWPFKAEQRVSEWRRVSLIELRPINNNSLAVAGSLLFSALRLIFVCVATRPLWPVSFVLPEQIHGAPRKTWDFYKRTGFRVPVRAQRTLEAMVLSDLRPQPASGSA